MDELVVLTDGHIEAMAGSCHRNHFGVDERLGSLSVRNDGTILDAAASCEF
jgi:hypothetical protein